MRFEAQPTPSEWKASCRWGVWDNRHERFISLGQSNGEEAALVAAIYNGDGAGDPLRD